MKKTKIKFFVSICIAICSIVLSSCETEIELNAPYKSTTVIFGLLDADANSDGLNNALDTQWIKINRTFLGSGNNLDYALIRDSSEYKEEDFVSKKVQRYLDGELQEEWNLTATTVTNKSVNGIFYSPAQTLYYFTPPEGGLPQTSTYKLMLDFANKEDVSAQTNIINSDDFYFEQPQVGFTFSMASLSGTKLTYPSPTLKWRGALNATSYDAVLRFHFKEYLYDNPEQSGTPIITNQFVDFNIGTYKVGNENEGGQFVIDFSGRAFFSLLENTLVASPNIKRVIGDVENGVTKCFDIIMSMGNEELNTYIEVNSPVSGIVQERPSYSNVSNGIGLFASRAVAKNLNLRMMAGSESNPVVGNLHGLCGPFEGSHCIGLNFCDPNPTSDYSCD